MSEPFSTVPLLERSVIEEFFPFFSWTDAESQINVLLKVMPESQQELWNDSHWHTQKHDERADRPIWVKVAGFSTEDACYVIVRNEGHPSEFRNKTIAMRFTGSKDPAEYVDPLTKMAVAIMKRAKERVTYEGRPVPEAWIPKNPELN